MRNRMERGDVQKDKSLSWSEGRKTHAKKTSPAYFTPAGVYPNLIMQTPTRLHTMNEVCPHIDGLSIRPQEIGKDTAAYASPTLQ